MDVKAIKTAALSGCVKRMKAEGLSGKLRDDAAAHYMAGVQSVLAAAGEAVDPVPTKYVDVLEQLATLADD